ncbi:MAG: hypothetical protein D6679_02195 [Candidatus Hydrogenedentota bacterium]|nr:MAG: hypothetical protein D6679_02195 [Candidatus Hydrogenedentota bacterium]
MRGERENMSRRCQEEGRGIFQEREKGERAGGGHLVRCLVVCCVALGLFGCETAQVTLPAYVRSIAIPTFINRTDRPGLELDVTQRVLHEFMSTSEVAVTPDPSKADAVIRGEVYGYRRIPISWDQTNRIVQYKIQILARVSFEDRLAKKIAWQEDVDGVTTYSLLATPPETEEQAIFDAADELARDVFFLVFEERQYTEDDLLFSDVRNPNEVTPGEVERR